MALLSKYLGSSRIKYLLNRLTVLVEIKFAIFSFYSEQLPPWFIGEKHGELVGLLSTFQLKSIIDGVEHNRTEPNKTKLNRTDQSIACNRPMCWQSILVQCYQLLHLNENPFLFCYICFSKLFISLFSSLISLSLSLFLPKMYRLC